VGNIIREIINILRSKLYEEKMIQASEHDQLFIDESKNKCRALTTMIKCLKRKDIESILTSGYTSLFMDDQ
jgi:hypothetical protein